MKILSYLCLILTCFSLEGKELVVRTPEGDSFILHVQPHDNCDEILTLLETHLGESDYFIDFKKTTKVSNYKAVKQTTPRNYALAVTSKEKEDIAFIVNTLGMSSLLSVAKNKSALKKAGDRIDGIHPLRFLMCVFTDEKMKVSMDAMQKRNWIWDEFVGGLFNSLNQESSRDNMKPEFIADFANTVGIAIDLVNPPITKKQWAVLIKTLIQNIPRKTDSGRYDI